MSYALYFSLISKIIGICIRRLKSVPRYVNVIYCNVRLGRH